MLRNFDSAIFAIDLTLHFGEPVLSLPSPINRNALPSRVLNPFAVLFRPRRNGAAPAVRMSFMLRMLIKGPMVIRGKRVKSHVWPAKEIICGIRRAFHTLNIPRLW